MKKILTVIMMFSLFLAGCTLSDAPVPAQGSLWIMAAAQAFPEREFASVCVFQDKIWVIGGHSRPNTTLGDIWSSPDGITWTQVTASAPFGPRRNHTCVVFDNKIWVIAGLDAGDSRSDVWYSSDGVNWTCAAPTAAFGARFSHASAVSTDRMWVIGGFGGTSDLNDVWSSADGVTWTAATTNAPFSKRQDHSAAFFQNRLWVIGGSNVPEFTDMTSDVWSSADGVTWTQISENQFTGVSGFPLLVADGKLWILGGFAVPHSRTDNVLCSSDGAAWISVPQVNRFGVRTGHGGAFFHNKLWVLYGQTSASSVAGDVWSAF